MKDGNYTAFRVVSWAILIVSLVIQGLFITYYWLDFDPRVSCERLMRWDEWISCMHGKSHLYIVSSEMAVGAWFAAGAAALVGRILPPYISITVPAGVAALCFWFLIRYWNESVAPHASFGVPSPKEVFVFAVATGLVAAYMAGPAAGAWLLGLRARARRRLARPKPVNA